MRSIKGLTWRLRGGEKNFSGSLMERLLSRREISPSQAPSFLAPRLSDANNPFSFSQMEKAVALLQEAAAKKKKVFLYGDYDVDGVASSVLLEEKLRKLLGLAPIVYLPERLKEGYGLKLPALQRMVKEGGELIITLDTGISHLEEIEFLKKKKVQVIILDHHEPKNVLPPADAILNPKIKGERYPFRELATSGLAWQLSRALSKQISGQDNLRENLELAALGTIADMVPLRSDNRIIVKFGLEELSASSRPWLRALRRLLALEESALNTYHVGFLIGPRLNAAGRMKHAQMAYQFLAAEDLLEAYQLAEELNRLNSLRQSLVEEILAEAQKSAAKQRDKKILVLSGKNWSIGVAGLVASRLVEKLHRPVLILEEDGELLKGSGRSIEGVDLHSLIAPLSSSLESFGGHPRAIGLSLKRANFSHFQKKLWQEAKGIPPERFTPALVLDEELNREELTPQLYQQIASLQPYGLGNEEPIFHLKGLRLREANSLAGQRGPHLKLLFDQISLPGILFGEGEKVDQLKQGDCVEAAVSLKTSQYLGHPVLRLQVHDLRLEK